MSQDLTIGQLGRQSHLSRATLLYYDRLGLLRPKNRSGANYRLYEPEDVARLERICFYRAMGIPLKDIARLLDSTADAGPAATILQRRLESLDREISMRQEQQRQIVCLVEQLALHKTPSRRRPKASRAGTASHTLTSQENGMVNKQRWIEIMRAAGFGEQAMHQWHHSFEAMEPDAHQEFLESLGIPAPEIARIREASRGKTS